jgi:hypothetical protein
MLPTIYVRLVVAKCYSDYRVIGDFSAFLNFASLKIYKTSHKPILCWTILVLHDPQPELSGSFFAGKQKKGTETDKLLNISCDPFFIDYFFKRILESSIHRRICNMVGVITDYF